MTESQGIGKQDRMQQTRGTDRTANPMQGAQNKGQLGENQLQNYLQGKANASQSGQQQMDARLLAESMKASGIQAG